MSTTPVDREVREIPPAPTPATEGARYRYAAVTVCGIWAALAAASIWSPDLTSDSDRTHVPIAALAGPLAGLLATAFAAIFAAGSTDDRNSDHGR